jgi:hypothetical protein
MHGEIDTPGGQGVFNLLGKNSFAKSAALGTDLGQGYIGDFVASSGDDFYFALVAPRAQQRRDVVSLPKREL